MNRKIITMNKKIAFLLLFSICFKSFGQIQNNEAYQNANELISPQIEKYKSLTKIDDGLKSIQLGKKEHYIIRENKVLFRAFSNEEITTLKNELEQKLDCKDVKIRGSYLTAWIDVTKITRLDAVQTLKYATAELAPRRNSDYKLSAMKDVSKKLNSMGFFVGTTTSGGDAAMGTDIIRNTLNVDGSGIRIGVISNSYNQQGGAAASVTAGDLPGQGNPNGYTQDVVLLNDTVSSNDEGRAMAEIIHDVAPGAEIYFRTAFIGHADYVDAINELAAAGCDIIVDDINYFDEPFFQDGIISQAVNQVTANGILYFTAALNAGFNGFESQFVDSGVNLRGQWGRVHDFGTNGSGTTVNINANGRNVTISALELNTSPNFTHDISLQWDDPSSVFTNPNGPGPDTDMTLIIIGTDNNGVLRPLAWSTSESIANGTPFDRLNYAAGPNLPLYLAISVRSGVNPGTFRFINFNRSFGFSPSVGTLVGHANATGAITTGAVRYDNSPAFNGVPVRENSSSAGGLSILLDFDGNPFPNPIIRQKPDFMAPDGANTSFFGALGNGDVENDGFRNFYGTSAAAPHAAAAVALMLEAAQSQNVELTKQQILEAINTTAIDMTNTVGYDISTGFGFIQANLALTNLISSLSVTDFENASDIKVYPNPLEGSAITISGLPQNNLELDISIYNMIGQKVYTVSRQGFGTSITLKIPELASGTYIFETKNSDINTRHKIIVN
jgi:hypothetical protein